MSDSYQSQECTQPTIGAKTICWCCMKPIIELYYRSGVETVYKLGDCCKELSTDVIHKGVD